MSCCRRYTGSCGGWPVIVYAIALVQEAYLRLVAETEIDWQNRAHFFGIAAVRMRTS
jgi:hypothetical protein